MNLDSDPTPAAPFRSIPEPPDLPPSEAEAIVPAHVSWWDRIGGGGLTISIVFHAMVLVLAVLIVYRISEPAKEQIEFLPGGGGGGKGSDARLAEQRRAATLSAPKTRTVSLALNAEIGLPDITSSMSDFSSLSLAAPMGGGIGGGAGGLNGKGSGGLMGNGIGTGRGPGLGHGFVSLPLFGMKIDAKRMAVVLDMSRSMYSFLPIVIKEVDKVAPGSLVILHYGCGLTDAEIRKPVLVSTSDNDFDKDRIVTSLMDSDNQSMDQEQREALLSMVKKRARTFFVPSSGVGSTWVALNDERLKNADAIYWFADFADDLSTARMEEIARSLRDRKQKLYIHPSNPKWLEANDPLAVNVARVEKALVKPSGGKVIKQDVKKETPVKEDKSPLKPDA